MRRPDIRTLIGAGLGLTVLALLINGVICVSNTYRIGDNNRRVLLTDAVLAHLEKSLSTFKDAETGQRGYLLTGTDSYLEPFRTAVATSETDLGKLRAHLRDNRQQQARLALLESKWAEKLAELQETIELKKDRGTEEAAVRIVRSDRGKGLMDDIRQLVATMEAAERTVMNERMAQSRESLDRAVATFVIATAIALVLVILYSVAVLRHLAARQKAQQTLQEQLERWQVTLASIADAVLVTDAEGRVTFLNAPAQALTERGLDEAVGQALDVVFPIVNEQTQERVENPVQQVFRQGTAVGLANHSALIARSGRLIPIEDSAAPIRDGGGRILGAVLVFHDVSERRRAEDALRQAFGELERRVQERTAELAGANAALRASEQQFRSLVEGVKDYAIFLLDPGGHVVSWNAGAELIKGYRAEEIIGRHFSCFYTSEDIARGHPANELELAATEGRSEDEGWRVRKDGSLFWTNVIITALRDGGGRLIGFAKISRDVTERREAEKKLKAFTVQLERSNRELSEFASVASHDLQEPLRKIQAFGDRLQAKYAEALGDQGRDYLERMQAAAGRMRSLISDLLTFSRVATQAQPFAPVDLGQVTSEVLSDLEGRIQQTAARVEVNCLPAVEADPMQMRQLLQNLIGNALKFHRPDEPPVVRVHGRPAPIPGEDPAADPHQCQIIVQDNGIGFDEKYLDRIFGVFQRLHGRGEYEGTGMGLAICRKIVERHGGSITARSTPGHGATFRVTLPLTRGNGGETS